MINVTIYIYICMYTYVNIYIYIFKYVYILYVCMYNMYVDIYIYIYIYITQIHAQYLCLYPNMINNLNSIAYGCLMDANVVNPMPLAPFHSPTMTGVIG